MVPSDKEAVAIDGGGGGVRLVDVAKPLWLPLDVNMHLRLEKTFETPYEQAFQNIHHYSNYRRYRVSSKIVTPN